MKKILLWVVLIFAIILIASIGIAVAFEKQIGQQLISAINKELVHDIEVDNFELSLLKGFPYVSARLNNVAVPDKRKNLLLEAETMSFNIGLLGLLRSNLNIGNVIIENGALFVEIDRKGQANFLITKESEEDQASMTGADFSLSLKEATLNNMELIYIDRQSKQEMKLFLQDASFTGEFDSQEFSLISDATIESNFVELEGKRYLVGKHLGYDATIYVDLNNGLYEFQDVVLTVDRNDFDIKGTVQERSKGTDFDLVVHNKSGNLESVIQLMPEEYEYLEGFSSRGKFVFDILLKGRLNATETPAVDFKFGLKDGSIQHDELGSSLKDVSFAASFTNGKSPSGKDAILEINNFKGYFNRELIESKLKVRNLNSPHIQLDLNGTLPVESIYQLMGIDYIEDGDGEMELRNIHINGNYEDMIRTSRIHKVYASGEIEFDDAAITINDEELMLDRGVVAMKDNQLRAANIKLEGAGSEILFDGYFTNVIPVLLADSINSKDAELQFDARLKAKKMDLDRLLTAVNLKLEEEELVAKGAIVDSLKEEQTEQREFITNFLNGTFTVDVAAFNYNEVEGEYFKGELSFKNKEMSIVGAIEDMMDGSIDIDGTTYFDETTSLKVNVICKDINANELFQQMEDFGQEVLSYKHLEGTLSTKMAISSKWDKTGDFSYDDLRVLADVTVKDGELNNFGMLEDFSSYVKVNDLRRIKFVDMRNWFEIKNQRIYIPVMLIQTNAMNMLLSGEHSFENRFDYNIKINAGQVLSNKFKKHNPDLKPQPAKTNGLFNLHFNAFGDFDDYEVKTNKSKVKQAFKTSEYRKNTIQSALDKEFGRAYRMEIPAAYEEKFKDIKDLDEFEEGNIQYLDPIRGGRN